MSVYILGLNAYHADASAALFVDGELAYAIEEERLNRKKHCAGFPGLAARRCIELSGVDPARIQHVAVSRDPRAQLVNKARYLAERAVRSLSADAEERSRFLRTLADRLANRQQLARGPAALAQALALPPSALHCTWHAVEHHRAHLASAFFASPFEESAVLSLDGFGDFVSTMWGTGRNTQISVAGTVPFPHSLGILYTAVCQWLGFAKYGDEGKIMGLSAYGEPRLLARMRSLIQLLPDGRFALNLRYFSHHRQGVDMTFAGDVPSVGVLYAPALCELLGAPRRPGPGVETQPYYCDVAASLQALLEEAVLHVARGLYERTRLPRLSLAGGVALNCVANAAILAHTPFRELYVQPAAGDNGTSVGAALWVHHQVLGHARRFVMRHAYTGPAFDRAACAGALAGLSHTHVITEHDEQALVETAAEAVAEGAIVGFFQGRMEFGPRALGHRSIVCDPRRADMKDILNRRIKHREPFRPFAPSVLIEHVHAWFERGSPSPSMLLVDRVRHDKRGQVPAITHQDGTGRLQTVDRLDSPLYHALISAFYRRTGVPMVLNTSFNEHEPIVCSPAEAVACFEKTQMDALALGPFFVRRNA